METDFRQLSSLLRTELTAVHQQFFHILALRQWKDEILLKRITEVDNVDFKNVMQTIDLLTSYDYPVSLESQNVQPGTNISGILRSELEMERHFHTVLQEIHTANSETSARVERAAAPRPSYRLWRHSTQFDGA